MKLNFPLLDVPIEIDSPTIFTVEEVDVFANLARWFYQYDDECDLKLFSRKQTTLKKAELMVVTDILGFDINAPSTLKLIYSDLEQQLNEKPEIKMKIEGLSAQITNIIGYELLDHELDLEEDEITVLELFKALGIKVETRSDSIYDKMLEIIQVFRYLSKKKLLVFINACSYLAIPELDELSRYVSLNNVKVLFVEPRIVAGFKQYVLDEDYFLQSIEGS